jgi:small subunit ribosomal protein S6
MRHYELMIILEPEVDERTVAPSLDKLLAVVTNGGGTVDKIDIWGKGIYAVVDMTTTPEVAKELDRQLGLNEAVLRTKLLRPDAA